MFTDSLPLVDFVPDQSPDAEQLDAEFDDQVKVTDELTVADDDEEDKVTEIVGALVPPPDGESEEPPPPPPPQEMKNKQLSINVCVYFKFIFNYYLSVLLFSYNLYKLYIS